MRARDVFMQSLVAHGARVIFGNPGTTENPLLMCLDDYPQLSYQVALHEGVAVCAAGAYAHASGRTGVANVHVAPGLGNAMGMMYGIMRAQVPVIVTAGQQDTRMRLRDPLLGYDLVAMADPVCKWAVQAESADEIGPIMQRAFQIANTYPRGPVFVALPNNVMEQQTQIGVKPMGHPRPQLCVDPDAVAHLVDMLNSSRSPLVIAGDDIAVHGANDALLQLVQTLGATVRTDFLQARQVAPADHPNNAGAMPFEAAAIRAVLEPHDLVLLIGGPALDEVWYDELPPFPEEVAVVQIEADPALLAQAATIDHALVGSLPETLAQIDVAVRDGTDQAFAAAAAQRNEQLRETRLQRQRRFASFVGDAAGRTPMQPAVALQTLADALPAKVVLVDESITAAEPVQMAFAPQGADDFFAGRGGGIGQGIAGALGVAAARPDAQIVAITGDGSAMYSIQALWTAAHHKLNIIFAVLANREYRVLKHNVDAHRRRFDDPSDEPYPHMDLTDPGLSFVDMARGMGVPGQACETPGEVRQAAAQAAAGAGPYVIELRVAGKAD